MIRTKITFITEQLRQVLPLVVLFFAVLAVNFIYAAWESPPSSPPNGNTSPPLHIGSGDQSKAGMLGATSLVAPLVTTDLIDAGTVCLGGDCESEWPSEGGVAVIETLHADANYGYEAPNSVHGLNFNDAPDSVSTSETVNVCFLTTDVEGSPDDTRTFSAGCSVTESGGVWTLTAYSARRVSSECVAMCI